MFEDIQTELRQEGKYYILILLDKADQMVLYLLTFVIGFVSHDVFQLANRIMVVERNLYFINAIVLL